MENKKTVTFTSNTYSPPPAEHCKCCKHYNIKPKIRVFFECVECHSKVCAECFNTLLICLDCEEELFNF